MFSQAAEKFKSEGNSLAGKKQYREAILQYEKALEIEGQFTAAWFNKGLMYKNLHEYDMACQNFKNALQCDPNHTKARFCIAAILLEQQEYLQAWQHFKKLDLSSLSKEEKTTAMLGIQKCENMIGAKVIFACADLKLTKDGKVKILEFGRGMQSSFIGLMEATKNNIADLLLATWNRFSRVPLFLNSSPGIHFSSRTAIAAYEDECSRFPPLPSTFTPDDLSNYHVVYGGWETQQANEQVLMTDAANVDFIFEDKAATHEAFAETDNLDARPKTMLIPRVYEQTLVANIRKEFPNVKRFVLKAPDCERGEGVYVFDVADLENVLVATLSNGNEKDMVKCLSVLFSEKKNIKQFEKNFDVLARLVDSKSQFFLLEEYIENKPILYNKKLYDATMRVAFLIVRNQGRITCEPFACYWKLPSAPMESSDDLREKTVSSYSHTRHDAVQVAEEDRLIVYEALEKILPKSMQYMFIADIPTYIEQKLVKQYQADAWMKYANTLAYRGEFLLAEHFLENAEKLLDKNNRFIFYHQHGIVSHLKKDYVKAIQYFKDALKERPGNTSTLFRKGVSYLALGDTEKMEECFSAAGPRFEQQINQVRYTYRDVSSPHALKF